MKFKIFTMLIVLAILSVTPMIYMGKFDPLSYISDLSFSGLDSIDTKSIKKLTDVVSDDAVQVYRWRDEKGVMQFSNTPPATGSQAEQIVLHTNSNVIQAVKVPVKEVKEEEPEQTENTSSPYSVKGMKKVMDDAKGVEQMLQQRNDEQQKLLNNI
jgi:hypothetical protein